MTMVGIGETAVMLEKARDGKVTVETVEVYL